MSRDSKIWKRRSFLGLKLVMQKILCVFLKTKGLLNLSPTWVDHSVRMDRGSDFQPQEFQTNEGDWGNRSTSLVNSGWWNEYIMNLFFFPNSYMSYVSSWWLQIQVLYHESNVYVFIPFTKQKDRFLNIHPQPFESTPLPLLCRKVFPHLWKEGCYTLPLATLAVRGCLVWVFAGVEVEAVWRRLKVTRIWNEQWKKPWSRPGSGVLWLALSSMAR